MKTLIRAKIVKGSGTGAIVLKEIGPHGLVRATYDLDGEQINDLGNHEWELVKKLGDFDTEDEFWALVQDEPIKGE